MLKDGKLNFYWTLCTNNMQAGPNLTQERYPGFRNPENFIVVSDAYPTVSALAADLILPAAMWMEKEGAYGNADPPAGCACRAGISRRLHPLQDVRARLPIPYPRPREGRAGYRHQYAVFRGAYTPHATGFWR